jgi:hypothetical protein
MDAAHRFHTEQTWRWVRAEHVALVAALAVIGLLHAREVAWGRFAAAFLVIDLVGYVPGAIAFRRSSRGQIPKIPPIYHRLYNFTHSYLTAGVVAGVWAAAAGRFEWAMLALPIHLSSDRGFFGNTYKPDSLPFEPLHDAAAADVGIGGGR